MLSKTRRRTLLWRSLATMLALAACTDSDAITEPARAPVPARPNMAAVSEVAVQVAVSDGEACVLKGDYNIVCWTRSNSPPAILAGACYGGAAGYYASEGSASHTIDPAITTTVLAATPTSQQYSDRVTLTATITPSSVDGSTPTGTVQFRIGGANVGSPVTLGSDARATLPNAQVTTAAGSRTIEAVFTSTNTSFKNSTGSATLTVTREDAAVVYNAANATALEVSTPGGSLDANALSLSIGVKENEPDAAVSPGTTGVGSVANAGLAVQLLPVGPGTTYTLTCTPGTVSGTGYQATRPFTCTNPASIAVNVYEVQVSVTGDHYTGMYDDAFTVFDRSLGFVSGGGTFFLNGDRVRFGINTKYKKNGDAVKGSAIIARTHADGTRSSLTSNALTGMAIGEDPTVPMGWAALNGKATYT